MMPDVRATYEIAKRKRGTLGNAARHRRFAFLAPDLRAQVQVCEQTG
jgi:hypothetical protein